MKKKKKGKKFVLIDRSVTINIIGGEDADKCIKNIKGLYSDKGGRIWDCLVNRINSIK